jgi:hypothetical protein
MFGQYHGFVYPSKESNKKNTNSNSSSTPITSSQGLQLQPQQAPNPLQPSQPLQPQTQTPQLATTSGLPIINIDEKKIPQQNNTYRNEFFKELLESKKEIRYIQPEIIPKETYSQKKQYVPLSQKKEYVPLSEKKEYNIPFSEKKQYMSSQQKKTTKKSSSKKKMSSLDKYKISINNKKPHREKEYIVKTPKIIIIEKKSKSKTKTKTKTKVKQPDDILSKIEMSDTDYKKKFDKLKKVYIKQHDSLINVFDGYQKLYEKTLKEEDAPK